MKTKIGTITKSGTVITDDHKLFSLPKRGMDDEGYPEVLIDAKDVGGAGEWTRQSVKPYIGMKCSFVTNDTFYGFNFKILKQ